MFGIEHMRRAIVNLSDATEEEKDTLTTILHVEGFGGREDTAYTDTAREIAKERLAWLRQQRAEGLR
jgi:hypothetical protein